MIVTNFSYGRKSGPGLDIVRFYPKKTAALKVQPSIAFLDFAKPSPQPERFLRTHRRSRRKPQVPVRCVDTATAKKLRPARTESWPNASSELRVSLALDFLLKSRAGRGILIATTRLRLTPHGSRRLLLQRAIPAHR